MQWILENWPAIIGIVTGIVAVASAIAKLTPNETDNQAVLLAQKAIDLLAANKLMNNAKTTKKK